MDEPKWSFQSLWAGAFIENDFQPDFGDMLGEPERGQLQQVVHEYAYALAAELEKRGLWPIHVEPFPFFSYVAAAASSYLLLLFGPSPGTRFWIFCDLRALHPEPTPDMAIAECRRRLDWQHTYAAVLPAIVLTQSTEDRRPALLSQVSSMVAQLEKQTVMQRSAEDDVDDGLCFVIMSFSGNPRLKDFYGKAIKPTVRGLGYRCERVDEQHFNDSIRQRILDNIRRARFIIADVTEARPNCYYELGIAHALGKDVIHITNEIKDVHFDIRDFNFIVYEDIDGLKTKLRERIRATEGERSKK